jgi:hypothetical protein
MLFCFLVGFVEDVDADGDKGCGMWIYLTD